MNSGAMIWSVRRELWENRSIYIAPLVVAGVMVLGFIAGGLFGPPAHAWTSKSQQSVMEHFDIAAGGLMATTLIVAIFYCLDALYGERRDRSVLFWKSMPVSDLTTVLSKIAVPLVILPVVTFVITIATEFVMLLSKSAFLLMSGQSVAPMWSLPWFELLIGILYHLITVHSLYYAPIFGWLLLVSAWAKRLPFLWAFIPMAAIGIIERLVFNSTHFAKMLGSRISGGMEMSAKDGGMVFWPVHPLEFLSRPGLWIGLAIAAACVAGAVRLRRYRSPI